MTVASFELTMAGAASVDATTSGSQGRLWARATSAAPRSSTLLADESAPWINDAIDDLIFRVASGYVPLKTFARCVRWLATIPRWVNRPSIGAGDDGSVSVEWEQSSRVLHVMFVDGNIEAFFSDDNDGNEWELAVRDDDSQLMGALRHFPA